MTVFFCFCILSLRWLNLIFGTWEMPRRLGAFLQTRGGGLWGLSLGRSSRVLFSLTLDRNGQAPGPKLCSVVGCKLSGRVCPGFGCHDRSPRCSWRLLADGTLQQVLPWKDLCAVQLYGRHNMHYIKHEEENRNPSESSFPCWLIRHQYYFVKFAFFSLPRCVAYKPTCYSLIQMTCFMLSNSGSGFSSSLDKN